MSSQERTASLETELCAWRVNRQLYPGWIIAPYQTRDRVWQHTRYWLDAAIQSGESWSSCQVIILWRELSWRLESCLQLVPDQAVRRLQCSVDSVGDNHGTEELMFDVEPLQDETWPRELRLSSRELREDWIECMLALLQSYRLRPDLTAFQKITDRLRSADYLSQNQQCHMSYQSCLVALAELDREKATSLVETWPEDPEDPYWLVKRAGVYLELGDELTATAVATDALEKIRRRRLSNRYGYWALSREGWCLRFLSQIFRSRHFLSMHEEPVPESDVAGRHRDFDRELEEARSSPDAELQIMQERISGRMFPPKPVERTRNAPDFDTGVVGETIHFGAYEPAARLGAAVNILRLCELSGLPPSVGGVGFFGGAVSEALLWVREEFPGLWAAFVFRYRGIGINEYREPASKTKQEAIRRDILDVLPVAHTKRLHDAAIRELCRVLEIVDSRGTREGGADRYDAIQSIRRLGSAATKFSICLGDQEREEVFVLFLRLSRADGLSQNPILQDTLWKMAWRTVSYFSTDMINKWATEIFVQFPLVSEETQQRRGWPEITLFVPKSMGAEFTRPISTEFDKGVVGLVELLSSSNLIDRTGAAWRLLGMYDRGLLWESECEEYKKKLWSVLDEHGLPLISSEVLRVIVHLQWPTEVESAVSEGLRSWIGSQKIGDRFAPREDQSGSGAARFGVTYPDPENYLTELLELGVRLSTKQEAYDRVFTPAVRKEVLAKILEWWRRERDRFMSQHRRPHLFSGNVFQRVEDALQVLFDCVLSDDVLDVESKAELNSFLEDLKKIDQTGVYWFQVATYLGIVSEEVFWAKVRADLWGNDSRSAFSALVAWSHWITKRKALGLGQVPRDVFVAIVSEIASVRGERCRQVCLIITQTVERGYAHGEDIDEGLLNGALNSAVVRLRKGGVVGSSSLGVGEQRELVPHLRRELTRLLVTLDRQGMALGQMGEDWLRRAKADRFIDVRFLVAEGEA